MAANTSREVDQLEPEADVGLVGAVALLRLVPRHARHRARTGAGDRLGGVEHRLADHPHHVVGVGEAHLRVELHELELPVGPQVLVAQAPGDLVVAVETADHEQLLEELRALRQRVELPRRQSRRHDEVARALGRRRDQHRRLDLDEPLRVERPVQRGVDLGAHAEVALQPRPAQVDVPVPEAEHLVGVDAVVDRERRRVRFVEHLERGGGDLDFTRRDGVVDGAVRAVTHRSLHPDHVLVAHAVDVGASRLLGIDDDLHQAGGVAHVEEHHSPVITAAVDPSADHDLAVDVGAPEIAGAIGAHHRCGSSVSRRSCNHPATASRGTSTCSCVRRSFTPTTPRSASRCPSITP